MICGAGRLLRTFFPTPSVFRNAMYQGVVRRLRGCFSERGLSLGHPIFALVPEEAEALGVPGKRRNGLLCLQDNEDARRNLWEEDDKIGGTWKPR